MKNCSYTQTCVNQTTLYKPPQLMMNNRQPKFFYGPLLGFLFAGLFAKAACKNSGGGTSINLASEPETPEEYPWFPMHIPYEHTTYIPTSLTTHQSYYPPIGDEHGVFRDAFAEEAASSNVYVQRRKSNNKQQKRRTTEYYDSYEYTEAPPKKRRTTPKRRRRTTTASYDYYEDYSAESTESNRRRYRPNQTRQKIEDLDTTTEPSTRQLTSTTTTQPSTTTTTTTTTATTSQDTTTTAVTTTTNSTAVGYGPSNGNENISITYGPSINPGDGHPGAYGAPAASWGSYDDFNSHGPPSGFKPSISYGYPVWYSHPDAHEYYVRKAHQDVGDGFGSNVFSLPKI